MAVTVETDWSERMERLRNDDGDSTQRAARKTAATGVEEERRTAAVAARESRRAASTAKEEGRQVAAESAAQAKQVGRAAADRSQEVVRTAGDEAKQLAGRVKEEASEVSTELFDQGKSLLGQTKTELQNRTQASAEKVVHKIRSIGDEAEALAGGNPSEAPTISRYVWDASSRCQAIADKIEEVVDDIDERGFEGPLQDLQRFARRRPAAFMLGAVVAGFGVGRILRSGSDGSDDDGSGPALPAAGQRSATSRAPATGRTASTGTRRGASASTARARTSGVR